MANTIRLKSGSGNNPSASDLVVGEVALRTDGNPKLFTKNDAGNVLQVNLVESGSITSTQILDGTIVNADINASAAIAGTKIDTSTFTTAFTITNSAPMFNFVDSTSSSAGNPDYQIKVNGGQFSIIDTTNSSTRLRINDDGHIDITGNLDANGGVDTTDLNVSGTGDIDTLIVRTGSISGSQPILNFTDTTSGNAGDPDYRLHLNGGVFSIQDTTNSNAIRLRVNTDGHVDVTGNLDVGNNLDVTGNISVTGTVDGVDIAARNTLFGALTASSGVLTDGVTATTQAQSNNSAQVATTAYVRTAVSNLVNSAPSTLDTLKELSDALGSDANFSTTVTNSIATKLPLAGGTLTGALTINAGINTQLTVKGVEADIHLTSTGGGSNKTWRILGSTGNNTHRFRIYDQHNSREPFYILDNGTVNVTGNLDVGAGLDVTGAITGTGDLTIDTNTLHVDSSNNRVGIGTISPSVSLDIEATTPTIRLTDSDASGTPESEIKGGGGDLVFSADRDNEKASTLMQFQTDGSTAMTIDSSQRIGIGTVSPIRPLSIGTYGSGNAEIALASSTTGYGSILFGDGGTGTDIYRGYLQYNHQHDKMLIATSSSARITILSGGTVQVAQDLEVGNGATITGTCTATAFAGDGSALTGVVASGSNASTLDNLDSTQFLRSDADDTTTGKLHLTYSNTYPLDINSSDDGKIVLQGSSSPFIRFRNGTTDKAYIQMHSNGNFYIGNQATGESLKVGSGSGGLTFTHNGTESVIFHDGNDGSGSGLDADTVDGVQGSSFLRSDVTTTFNANGNDFNFESDGSRTLIGFQYNGSRKWELKQQSTGENLNFDRVGGSGVFQVDGNRVLTTADEGSGNGIDADTLDGVQGSSFLRSDATDTASGALTFTNTTLTLSGHWFSRFYSSTQNYIHLYPNGHSGNASSTDIRAYNGVNGADVFKITGGSATGLSWRGYTIWTAENDGSGSGLDADTLDGVQGASFVRSDASDTLTGGTYTFSSSTNEKIILSGASYPFIRFQEGTTDKAYIQWYADGYIRLRNEEAQDELRVGNGNNGLVFAIDGTARNVFHTGNDGSGSGLDADTLDGVNSGSFVRSDASDTLSGDYTFTGGAGAITITSSDIRSSNNSNWTGNPGSGALKIQAHSNRWYIVANSGSNRIVQFRQDGTDRTWIANDGQIYHGSSSSGDKYWRQGNDGSGSGLDADTVDGTQANSLIRSGAQSSVSGWHISAYRNGSGTSPHIYFSHNGGYGQHINTYNTSSSVYALQLHNNSKELFAVYNDGSAYHRGNTRWDDGYKAQFGTNSDLSIWHDGSHTRISHTGTGQLVISGNDNDQVKLMKGNSEEGIVLNNNGNVELYHNNDRVFRTETRGVRFGDNTKMFENSSHNTAIIQHADIHHAIIFRGRTNNNGSTITNENTTTFREYGQFKFRTGAINAPERFTIASNGNIGAPSGSNIYNASDVRLKKNITTLDKGLDIINNLRPVSFNWIDGFCDEEKDPLYGFIAQEVETVDTNLIQAFSEEVKIGEDQENPEQVISNTLRVNEKFIIPILVKALQELTARVKDLESKNNS